MANALEIIKRQIEEQVRDPLNADLTQAKVVGVGSKRTPKLDDFEPVVKDINPYWTVGEYVLQRTSQSNSASAISPVEFKEAGANIKWYTVAGKVVNVLNMAAHTNVMAGIQVHATDTNSFFLAMGADSIEGAVAVYTKNEIETDFNLVYSAARGSGGESINIPVSANTWTTIVITFYTSTPGRFFSFGSSFEGITAWRHLDVTSPTSPSWSIPGVEWYIQKC